MEGQSAKRSLRCLLEPWVGVRKGAFGMKLRAWISNSSDSVVLPRGGGRGLGSSECGDTFDHEFKIATTIVQMSQFVPS